jgi:hypothetical protein
MKWPRKKSMDKLKDTIRNKTGRTDGWSLRDWGNPFLRRGEQFERYYDRKWDVLLCIL